MVEGKEERAQGGGDNDGHDESPDDVEENDRDQHEQQDKGVTAEPRSIAALARSPGGNITGMRSPRIIITLLLRLVHVLHNTGKPVEM